MCWAALALPESANKHLPALVIKTLPLLMPQSLPPLSCHWGSKLNKEKILHTGHHYTSCGMRRGAWIPKKITISWTILGQAENYFRVRFSKTWGRPPKKVGKQLKVNQRFIYLQQLSWVKLCSVTSCFYHGSPHTRVIKDGWTRETVTARSLLLKQCTLLEAKRPVDWKLSYWLVQGPGNYF